MNRGGTNPVFSRVEQDIENVQGYGASYKGIIIKTSLLLLTVIASGMASLFLMYVNPIIYLIIFFVAMILGFMSVMLASSSPRLAKPFSFIYAACEGVFLGIITVMYQAAFPESPIVFLAVLITFGIFVAMLVLYSTKIIVASTRFRRVMLGVSFSILSIMLLVGIVSLFDRGALWYSLFGNPDSPLVLFVSLLFIFYGAFMLVLNFDNANLIVSQGADKEYEWTVSLGLIVSIVYIYVQVLRLLAIILLRNRD